MLQFEDINKQEIKNQDDFMQALKLAYWNLESALNSSQVEKINPEEIIWTKHIKMLLKNNINSLEK